jgi:hypothetical protein
VGQAGLDRTLRKANDSQHRLALVMHLSDLVA